MRVGNPFAVLGLLTDTKGGSMSSDTADLSRGWMLYIMMRLATTKMTAIADVDSTELNVLRSVSGSESVGVSSDTVWTETFKPMILLSDDDHSRERGVHLKSRRSAATWRIQHLAL